MTAEPFDGASGADAVCGLFVVYGAFLTPIRTLTKQREGPGLHF
jgi:hypothetical protein